MKYLIETYGCQLNKAESDALEILLKGWGIEKTENPDEADAVILNTCSVRKTAENRIWGRLGFYSAEKRKHGTRIIVTGISLYVSAKFLIASIFSERCS